MIIRNTKKCKCQLSDIDPDNYVSIMDDNANIRADLKLPNNEMGLGIRDLFEKEGECMVTVLSSCDKEMVVDLTNIH